MALFEGIVHLTEAQYQDLIANGSITDGVNTLVYNRNTLYVTDSQGSAGPTSTSELTNDGDGTSPFATQNYVSSNSLPVSTKYGNNLSLTIDSSTYVLTAQLKDQDGNNLGTAQTIDLPLESAVVDGRYDSATKKVILVLRSGATVDFSVADLVSGLQTEITVTNKLSADLVDDTSSTNKFVTSTEKTTWNSKQDAISDLGTIRSNATAGKNASDTIANYGNIVTHNTSEFAISSQGAKADTAVQPEDLANIATSGELADAIEDATHRLVTDTEKSNWNNKQATLVSGTNIKTINGNSLLGSGNITISSSGSHLYQHSVYFDITLPNEDESDVLTYTICMHGINMSNSSLATIANNDISDFCLELGGMSSLSLHLSGTTGSADEVLNVYSISIDDGGGVTWSILYDKEDSGNNAVLGSIYLEDVTDSSIRYGEISNVVDTVVQII